MRVSPISNLSCSLSNGSDSIHNLDAVDAAWAKHEARRSALREAKKRDEEAARAARIRQPRSKPRASNVKLDALRKKLRLQSQSRPTKNGSSASGSRSMDMRLGDDDFDLFDSMANRHVPLSSTLPPLLVTGEGSKPSSGPDGPPSRNAAPTPLTSLLNNSSSSNKNDDDSPGGAPLHPPSESSDSLSNLGTVAQVEGYSSDQGAGVGATTPSAAGEKSGRLKKLAPTPLMLNDTNPSIGGLSTSSGLPIITPSPQPGSGSFVPSEFLDALQHRMAAQEQLLTLLQETVDNLAEETSKSRSTLRKRFAAVDSRIERSEKLTQKLSRDLQMQIDHSESVVYSYSNKLRRVEQAMIGRVTRNSSLSDAALSWLVSVIFIALWFVRIFYRAITCSCLRSSDSDPFDNDDIDLTPSPSTHVLSDDDPHPHED